jgi:membrane protein implicated in regulation of membrane protease activity
MRLLLAGFGLVTMTVFAVLAFNADLVWLGVLCVVFAVVAVVDLVIIQRRRAARRREEPGARHSLFE